MDAINESLQTWPCEIDESGPVHEQKDNVSKTNTDLVKTAGKENINHRNSDKDVANDFFPFLSLPHEIRKLIYFKLFHDQDGIQFKPDTVNGSLQSERRYSSQLMFTCSQIWEESLPVLYGSNTFWIKVPLPLKQMKIFLGRIGWRNAAYVQTVQTVENYIARPIWYTRQKDFGTEAFYNLTNLYLNFYLPEDQTVKHLIKAFKIFRTRIFQRYVKLSKVFVVSLHHDCGDPGNRQITVSKIPAKFLASLGWDYSPAHFVRFVKLRFCEQGAAMVDGECTVSALHRFADSEMRKGK